MTESKRALDRKRKLHRLLTILRKLDNREKCTPESLSHHFETTARNIYRDMNDLNAAGFAITFDRDNGSYRFVDSDFALRDLDLTKEELTVLLVGKQLGQSLGKPFEQAYQSLIKKAQKETGAKTRGRLKDIEAQQCFWIDLDPVDGFDAIAEQYNAVTKAIEEKKALEIEYKGMGSQEDTKRTIDPYGLFLHKGVWYALAYCHYRKSVREFALDCVKSARLTKRHYSIPADFSMEEYFKPGWHIITYGNPVEVVLRFSSEIARWIKRRRWHPTQIIEENKDGSILFKVKLTGTEEIKRWTYSWAPHCEVLAPKELRKEVAKEVKLLKELYKG